MTKEKYNILRRRNVNVELRKWKNARVIVQSIEEKYIVQFKVLSDDLKPRALHKVIRNKVVVTTLGLSTEAAISLFDALLEQLAKDGHMKVSREKKKN